jgi:hypothetical protein
MPKVIRKPITLRITAAEVLESQLSPDDLRALALDDGNGGGGTLCPTVYCSGGYSGPQVEEEMSTPVEGKPRK